MISENTISKKMVLNKEYGGFDIPKIAEKWLVENKDWKKPEYRFTNTFEFRSNPDLVECIETLQKKYRESEDSNLKKLFDLKVVTLNIEIEIKNYDGVEEVKVFGNEDYEEDYEDD